MTSSRNARALLAATALTLAASACSDQSDPTAPRPALSVSQQAAPQASPHDPVGLARNVPGFGGFFLDSEGAPTVWLTDPSQRGAAAAALAPFLRTRGLDPSQLRVLRADFLYGQLERWFDDAWAETLGTPGAVFADLDEASNRLRIGVQAGVTADAVRRTLGAFGVPLSAVIIQETSPIRNLLTLQDLDRPVRAGVQIDFILGICSLGFNAIHVQSRIVSFVSASHCTWGQGGNQGTPFYQPTWFDFFGSQNQIGTEIDDPLYFSSPRRGRKAICPPNRVCRYSDAARSGYIIPFDQIGLGWIALTDGMNTQSLNIVGTLQVDPSQPEFTSDRFTVGSVVHKTGRTTGWTSDQVSATCVNANVDGTAITQLCQTIVGTDDPNDPVLVGPGDSGSPTYVLTGLTGLTTATLAGILWGGTLSGKLFVFSPLVNVQKELGDLQVIP